MADALTTFLNLTNPEVGASSDTWGTKENADRVTVDAMLATLITGLTLSAAGSTATFGIALGAAAGMVLSSAYTKTTSAWALGTAAGSLDTGAIANSTWYNVYLIQRSDTGVVDILTSLQPVAGGGGSPTMPTNYDRKWRIGSMRTDGSAQWRKFSQKGNEFLWDIPAQDATNVAVGVSTAQTVTLTTPLGVKTNALFTLEFFDSASGAGVYASSLDQSDQAASGSGAVTLWSSAANVQIAAPLNIRTNTSSQIRIRFTGTAAAYWINTAGWIDTRGQ